MPAVRFSLVLSALLLCCCTSLLAQDSVLVKTLQQNRHEFTHQKEIGFSGAGWNNIIQEANKNQYFLLGEIHGINELPLLIDELTRQVQYQTFVAEIDPWLAGILEEKVSLKSEVERQQWYAENGHFLSFYSYQQDFKLLQNLAKRNIRFAGIDQITALNDGPVYAHLGTLTRNKNRRAAYTSMAVSARQALQDYADGKTKAPYLMSDQFKTDLANLTSQKVSAEEQQILDKLALSNQIYTMPRGHYRRINLMKQQLMEYYAKGLLSRKTLFRMGAMHSSRHESFFTNFDVGNLAHNLAESQNATSYHLAVFAKTGTSGPAIKGKPVTAISPQKGLELPYQLASDTNWTYFDLRPARELLEKQKLTVESETLRKIIKGYDGLVIVPVATAAEF